MEESRFWFYSYQGSLEKESLAHKINKTKSEMQELSAKSTICYWIYLLLHALSSKHTTKFSYATAFCSLELTIHQQLGTVSYSQLIKDMYMCALEITLYCMGRDEKRFSKCGTCYLLYQQNFRHEVLFSSGSSNVFLPTVTLFTHSFNFAAIPQHKLQKKHHSDHTIISCRILQHSDQQFSQNRKDFKLLALSPPKPNVQQCC